MFATPPQVFLLAIILIGLAVVSIQTVIRSDPDHGRFVWALVIAVVLTVLSCDRSNYAFMMQEDGPAEWATFYIFLVAGLSFARRAWRQNASSSWRQTLGLGLLALFCFFVAGEEISWAQRLFGFKPPQIFLEKNYQLEANFHNILKDKSLAGIPLDSKYFVILTAGLFGAGLPVFQRLFPETAKPVSGIIPKLRFTPLFLLTAWAEWAYPVKFTGEGAELYLGCLFFLSQNTRPQRRNHFVLVGTFILAALTPSTVGWMTHTDTMARTALAQKEVRQLGRDLIRKDVLRKEFFKKDVIHKRIFTAEQSEYFKPGVDNEFLEGKQSAFYRDGRRDRIGYYLDPWNSPYWIKWIKKARVLVIYSFGPNRRRDILLDKKIKNREDDIAVAYKIPSARIP